MHTLISNLDYTNSQLSEFYCLVPASLDNRGCIIYINEQLDEHAESGPELIVID